MEEELEKAITTTTCGALAHCCIREPACGVFVLSIARCLFVVE